MTATSPVAARRFLLGIMAMGLAAIFVASFLYRLEHPSLRVPGKQPAATMGAGGAGGAGGAANVGEAMQAIRELMGTVEREPNNVKALVSLADAFVQIGALERAASLLERASAIEPGRVDILERLGFAFSETGKNDQAAEVFGRILAAEPANALAHFNLGFVERYHLGKEASAWTTSARPHP
jgi:tetratricopeptide (TPR) repeat protein